MSSSKFKSDGARLNHFADRQFCQDSNHIFKINVWFCKTGLNALNVTQLNNSHTQIIIIILEDV